MMLATSIIIEVYERGLNMSVNSVGFIPGFHSY